MFEKRSLDTPTTLVGHKCPTCGQIWILSDCIKRNLCSGLVITCPLCDPTRCNYVSEWYAYKEDPFIKWVKEQNDKTV